MGFTIPIHEGFRYLHEPHDGLGDDRFVGREGDIEEFVRRLQYSRGGSFLVTEYRGVGKTSFVNKTLSGLRVKTTLLDVHLNLARPMLPAELMHLIVRHLYERLLERGIYQSLPVDLKSRIQLAYERTSANVVRKLSQSSDTGIQSTEASIHGVKLPLFPTFNFRRSRSIDFETSLLAYDDRSAEHDIIEISRTLSSGVAIPVSRRDFPWSRLWRPGTKHVPLKVVFVFDEMDKLDDMDQDPASPQGSSNSVEQMLRGLKTLLTTSGICFVFIAGKDLHERWINDLSRGDSVYESVFSYDKYLTCMWSDIDQIADNVIALDDGAEDSGGDEVLQILKQYLRFMGRGIPRRYLRTLNGMVRWPDDKPQILLGNEDLKRVTFFARLNELLESNGTILFGKMSDDRDGTRHDRRRLGVYYLVDWILRRGATEFSVAEVLGASRELSKRIALAEEVAPGVVASLVEALVRTEYLEVVPAKLDNVVIGTPISQSEKRYRVTARRVAEISGISYEQNDIPSESTDEPAAQSGSDLPTIGRFSAVEILGTGGMGRVYKALDPRRGGFIALKVMQNEISHEADIRERFLREVNILQDLRHKNIVRFLEAGESEGYLYFAMDLIEGCDLRLILGNLGRVPLETALAVLVPIGDAIGFIHSRGYNRLDLKPGNIRISFAGEVFLLDFGIAKSVERSQAITREGQIIGTLSYMAPEQFRFDGAQIDSRADIYAFGAVLYETLVGAPPFPMEDFPKTIARHLHETPKRPSEHIAEIPMWIDEITMRCLEKEPTDRFQTMEELLDEIRNKIEITAPSVEVGLTARRATQRSLDIESSRRARTAIEPAYLSAILPPLTVENRGAEVGSAPFGDTMFYSRSPVPNDTYLTYGEEDRTGVHRVLKGSGRVTIGSALDNDIVLKDEEVSRYHAQIEYVDSAYLLVDLNSSNGTYLRGERVLRPQPLRANDRFRIGKVIFVFSSAPPLPLAVA